MNIDILQLTEGAQQATGLTVVIDVFRAFSTACYLFSGGARTILPVGQIEEALQLRERFPEAILIGERSERKVEGFDYGNSPTLILDKDFRGKEIILTTSSGTKGLMNAIHADEIITGSFVNASAIARYIRKQNPAQVSLVCMGYEGRYPTDEDTLLAHYVKALLEGKTMEMQPIREQLATGDGARLLDPATDEWSPAADFHLCLMTDRFDFVLKLVQEEGIYYLKKIR